VVEGRGGTYYMSPVRYLVPAEIADFAKGEGGEERMSEVWRTRTEK